MFGKRQSPTKIFCFSGHAVHSVGEKMSVCQIRVYRFFWRTASPVLVPIQDSPLAHPDGKVPAYDMRSDMASQQGDILCSYVSELSGQKN